VRMVLLIALTGLLSGCFPKPQVHVVYRDVVIPAPYRVSPPAALAEPYTPSAFPEFKPGPVESDGSSTVLLDQQGISHLKTILRTLSVRDEAWRSWSLEPVDEPSVTSDR